MFAVCSFHKPKFEFSHVALMSMLVAALQVVQGIKVLGANVRHREKERAERATLVTQERLVKGKVHRPRGAHVPVPCADGGRCHRLQSALVMPACCVDSHAMCTGIRAACMCCRTCGSGRPLADGAGR